MMKNKKMIMMKNKKMLFMIMILIAATIFLSGCNYIFTDVSTTSDIGRAVTTFGVFDNDTGTGQCVYVAVYMPTNLTLNLSDAYYTPGGLLPITYNYMYNNMSVIPDTSQDTGTSWAGMQLVMNVDADMMEVQKASGVDLTNIRIYNSTPDTGYYGILYNSSCTTSYCNITYDFVKDTEYYIGLAIGINSSEKGVYAAAGGFPDPHTSFNWTGAWDTSGYNANQWNSFQAITVQTILSGSNTDYYLGYNTTAFDDPYIGNWGFSQSWDSWDIVHSNVATCSVINLPGYSWVLLENCSNTGIVSLGYNYTAVAQIAFNGAAGTYPVNFVVGGTNAPGNEAWHSIYCGENITIQAEPLVCSFCTEACSPCGGGCTATDLSSMYIAYNFTSDISGVGNISGWDTSCIINMSRMFRQSDFNQDISGWNTSSVDDMNNMFYGNKYFNQSISAWDTSRVKDMRRMFYNAIAFNQPISSWDTHSVTDMSYMFSQDIFNQDISGWNTSNVISMSYMFETNQYFDQPIGSWDIHNVTSADRMFQYATAFNQDLSGWDTSNILSMAFMFDYAANFDQPIGSWDTSRVTSFVYMLEHTSFNQDISGWNTSSATNMLGMLKDTHFSQDISSWDVSHVTDMADMLSGVNLSIANYDALLLGWSSQSIQPSVSFHAGYSQYSSSGLVGRDLLINNHSWAITDGGLYTPLCTPDWVCIGYEDCVSPAAAAACNNAYDINLCNESYSGNFSEFMPSTCTYPLTGDALIAKNNNIFINILVIMLIVGILGMILLSAFALFGVDIDMTIIAVIAAAVVVLAIIILVISFGSITTLV